ncbi:hypothetical protein ACFQ2B_32620 [Streptomyces stramineus]
MRRPRPHPGRHVRHRFSPATTPRSAPAPAAAPAVPAPGALRQAATEGARAIDDNAIGTAAGNTARACDAARAPGAEQRRSCAVVKEQLDGLNRARATLRHEAAQPKPDLAAITTATTDAVAATARLAKSGVAPAAPGKAASQLPAAHHRDGGGGLLGVVTGLVSGLVGALSGVVGGLTDLVGGLLKGLLSN